MASQQTFRCVVCYRNADGYIELALDWRNEPLSQLYICKRDYDRIHSVKNQPITIAGEPAWVVNEITTWPGFPPTQSYGGTFLL